MISPSSMSARKHAAEHFGVSAVVAHPISD
jgi:hypothetical protein